MKFNPKLLHNPTDKVREFKCAGETHIFQPGEKRILDGLAADHALKEDGLGLVEFSIDNMKPEVIFSDKTTTTEVNYGDLPWKELVKLGSASGVFKPGMKKDALVEALRGLDEQA